MSDLYTYSLLCCDCTLCGIKLDKVDPYDLDDETYAESPPRWYPELWKQDNVALSSLCYFKRPNPFSAISDDSIGCDPVYEDTDEKGSFRRVALRLDCLPSDMIQPQRQNWYCNSRNRNLYFIALHAPCLRIAKRAMQLSPTAHVRTLGDLWLALERRTENVIKLQDGLIPIPVPFIPAIPEDPPKSGSVTRPVKLGLSRYFVDPKRVLGAVDDHDWEEDAHGPPLTDRWWNADPIYIPHLTHSLLSNLNEYEPTPNPLSSFNDDLEALPQEIKDRILQFLPYDIPLECTYLLDQSHWCALFVQIPFLWDLNLTMVHAKLSGNTLGGQGVAKQYDWERLMRQVLTPMNIVDPDVMPPSPGSYARVGLVVPPGLQNRRRIWQIVEEMQVGDIRMEDLGLQWAHNTKYN